MRNQNNEATGVTKNFEPKHIVLFFSLVVIIITIMACYKLF